MILKLLKKLMINDKRIKFIFLIICLLQIFYIFQFRSGFKYEVLKNPFGRDTGINYALPLEVVEIRDVIIKKKVNNFNLSEDFINNKYLYQRAIEFNYPIRIKKDSKFIFYLKNESISNSCQLIESGNYIKLAKC